MHQSAIVEEMGLDHVRPTVRYVQLIYGTGYLISNVQYLYGMKIVQLLLKRVCSTINGLMSHFLIMNKLHICLRICICSV